MKIVPGISRWFLLAGVGWFGTVCQTMWAVSFTFTTISYPGAYGTYITGINDAGEAVGYAYTTPNTTQGFVYEGGVFTPVAGEPIAINNNGTILMQSESGPYELNGSTITPIVLPSGISSFAHGINDAGEVVGTYSPPSLSVDSGMVFGYVVNGSTFQTLTDPGSYETTAIGINDLGQVVGGSEVSGESQPFLYEGGTYQTLPIPTYSVATGINDLGEIVGTDLDGGFVDVGGVVSFFSGPPGSLLVSYPLAINDLGQIAGTWYPEDGSSDFAIGFIGTPVGTPVPSAPTPEPGTIGLVGTAMVGLAGAVRRHWPISLAGNG